MKKLIFLLIAIVCYSCGSSKYNRLSNENVRLVRENSSLRETTQIQADKNKRDGIGSNYYSQGGLVKNISGIIIAKAINRSAGTWIFYIKLENNKHIRWETTQRNYESKTKGSTVFFEYIGKYRFRDKLIQ